MDQSEYAREQRRLFALNRIALMLDSSGHTERTLVQHAMAAMALHRRFKTKSLSADSIEWCAKNYKLAVLNRADAYTLGHVLRSALNKVRHDRETFQNMVAAMKIWVWFDEDQYRR